MSGKPQKQTKKLLHMYRAVYIKGLIRRVCIFKSLIIEFQTNIYTEFAPHFFFENMYIINVSQVCRTQNIMQTTS